MRHGICAALIAVAAWIGLAGGPLAQAQQERRVALVIGNAAYRNPQVLPRLTNATNDSRAMAEVLARLGFEVERADDRDKRALEELLVPGLAGARFRGRSGCIIDVVGGGPSFAGRRPTETGSTARLTSRAAIGRLHFRLAERTDPRGGRWAPGISATLP